MAGMKESTNEQLKAKIHEVIFEADSPLGKKFDVWLMIFIVASVIVVMLETVGDLGERFHFLFYTLEWIFTIFFTIEYILRLYCVFKPIKYATSFFGVIDLLAILPTYVSLFVAGTQYLIVIRALRLLRVFRIFKMIGFVSQGQVILKALQASRQKIAVFLFFILLMVTILGSIMYLVEGGRESGFDSIPRAIYWAIVTLTTVGYGDISPTTSLGQFFAAIVMIMGYSVIAVPTGIVSAEFIRSVNENANTQSCRYCTKEGHDDDAEYCKYCGESLKIDF
jgi:voltage-gated potassium channel